MKTVFHPATRITSRTHPWIKSIRDLQNRRNRDAAGLCLIEGVRFLSIAVEQRVPIEELVVAPELLRGEFGRKLIRRLVGRGVRLLETPPEVLHSIATTDDPQGVLAVAKQEWLPLEQADPHEGLCWVVLSEVQSLGNFGSLIRTAEAVGAAGAILLGPGPDPYDPACIRGTMSGVFGLRYVRSDLRQLQAWTRRRGVQLVGSSPVAEADFNTIRYISPTALFIGGERKGLSDEEKAACDALVRIPMTGRSNSLNLAVASGVLLYEIFNQSRARQPADDTCSSVNGAFSSSTTQLRSSATAPSRTETMT